MTGPFVWGVTWSRLVLVVGTENSREFCLQTAKWGRVYTARSRHLDSPFLLGTGETAVAYTRRPFVCVRLNFVMAILRP